MYGHLRRHLQLKLVAVVVLGVVVAFGVIGWIRIADEKARTLDELRRSGHERVVLLAAASANLLVGYDYSNMEALAGRVLGQSDVQQVLIRNAAGKPMVRREKTPSASAELVFEAPIVFGPQSIGTASLTLSTAKLGAEAGAAYAKVAAEQLASALMLGLLIYVAASRTIVGPIRRISQRMTAAIEANFTGAAQPLQVRGDDEIATLGRIFNELHRRVAAAHRMLQQKVEVAHSDLMVTNAELHKRTGELERALALVQALAVTDALTGLHNRRYFDERLAADFSRSRELGEPLTLVLIDVDHFKHINDNWGHAAGDALLQALAAILAERCRETDLAARLGGDEFALLLYRTDVRAAAHFARHLLDRVAAAPVQFQERPIALGVSIGLAGTSDRIDDVEQLYAAADRALYEAKRSGRNRYATHADAAAEQPP